MHCHVIATIWCTKAFCSNHPSLLETPTLWLRCVEQGVDTDCERRAAGGPSAARSCRHSMVGRLCIVRETTFPRLKDSATARRAGQTHFRMCRPRYRCKPVSGKVMACQNAKISLLPAGLSRNVISVQESALISLVNENCVSGCWLSYRYRCVSENVPGAIRRWIHFDTLIRAGWSKWCSVDRPHELHKPDLGTSCHETLIAPAYISNDNQPRVISLFYCLVKLAFLVGARRENEICSHIS